jgi:serine/threonine-protein kinase
MEFLFGEPLGRYLAREDVLPGDIALPALRQAASALAAAHAKGVIHRDVKPDNMYLVGEPGDPYELKVLDFGFSKLQTSELTAAGSVLGTPTYMAPEQALAETVDERSDVYALGMVMYRCFTGVAPFAGDDVVVLAHQIHSPLMRPTELVDGLDPRIERVILTATRKDPAKRYPAMDILFDDLGKLGDANARLWAFDADDHAYRPTSKIGGLVAESLLRTLTD